MPPGMGGSTGGMKPVAAAAACGSMPMPGGHAGKVGMLAKLEVTAAVLSWPVPRVALAVPSVPPLLLLVPLPDS